jgi:foldase protein PrsA
MEKKSLNAKPNTPKKNLVMTRRQSNTIKIIVTIAVLLVAALAYYIIDSGSYVATVDGNRISKAEYRYFLSEQMFNTESEAGILYSSQEDKDKFWLKPADGQDPWAVVKGIALDLSKDFMIERLKANEMGLRVDSATKSEIESYINSLMQSQGLTERQFAKRIRDDYNISLPEFKGIYENVSLIEKFKTSYLSKNYKPAELKDEEIKTYYDKDTKKFDKVDIRFISLSKLDDQSKELPQDQLDAKKKLAEEALNKIKQGEDINKVIEKYTEEKPVEGSEQPLGTAKDLPYYTGSELYEWVFANNPNDSGIVETDTGIFVVKIEKRTSFDDAKATVKSTMESEAREKFYNDAKETWRKEARYNIIPNPRVYDSISYK